MMLLQYKQPTSNKKHARPTTTTTMKGRIFPMCSSRVVIAIVVAVVILEAIDSIIGSLIVVFTYESKQGSANTTETIVSDNHAHQ